MNTNRRSALLVVLLAFFSCGRIENSNSTDKFRFGDSSIQGSTQFVAAATVIQNKCTFCHDHAHWKPFTSDDYVNAGLAVPNSIDDSPIFYRNQNASVNAGPHNMPINGNPALTPAELDLVAAWINSL